MSWHADEAILKRYLETDGGDVTVAAVEAHLAGCPDCRVTVGRFVDTGRLERTWERIVNVVDVPRPTWMEVFLRRAGVPEHVARLLAATPSLRASWIGALAAALAFSVVAAHVGGDSPLLFLVVAPLLPLAGVAAAYGPALDPAYEVGLASPLSSVRLLLLRAAAVLTTTVALAAAASLLLPVLSWTAAAWLLPALALTLASLALTVVMGPVRAPVVVGAGWLTMTVGALLLAADPLILFRGVGQLASALTAAVAAVVVVRGRDSFERRRVA